MGVSFAQRRLFPDGSALLYMSGSSGTVCWPAGKGTLNVGTSKTTSLEGRDILGTCIATTAAIKSPLMMCLNRQPEHDPFYAFDLAKALSL